MNFLSARLTPPAASIRYAQATPQQLSRALLYLQEALRLHFPTLAWRTWVEALAALQPDVWVAGERVTLAYADLTQLAQHLADAPELPVLDPPLYGPQALVLAQRQLHLAELAVRCLPELEANPHACGPHLYALVGRLARGHRLAEAVVQARRWGLAARYPLPGGVPGRGPAPGSPEVEQRLLHLGRACGSVPY